MVKKTTQLKQLLQSERLEFIMEAHNGLSAKIVEEALGEWPDTLRFHGSTGQH